MGSLADRTGVEYHEIRYIERATADADTDTTIENEHVVRRGKDEQARERTLGQDVRKHRGRSHQQAPVEDLVPVAVVGEGEQVLERPVVTRCVGSRHRHAPNLRPESGPESGYPQPNELSPD